MSELLGKSPYEKRDDEMFIKEMNHLTTHHMDGCEPFRRIWDHWSKSKAISDFPFLHVGLFKELSLVNRNVDVKKERVLYSSSTSGISSKIQLDAHSSKLQAYSSSKILENFLGTKKRPLLVLDSVQSLRQRGSVSARIAAAMSLKFLAKDMVFLLVDHEKPAIKFESLRQILLQEDELIVYGFSWILWVAWASQSFPDDIVELLKGKTISFIHSGGWKRLENEKVNQKTFDTRLLNGLSNDSLVVDYYGLVEQIGIIYPQCEHGYRHVPVWADIIIRDIYSQQPITDVVGQIQLLNVITWGAPYHSVLTEDIGIIVSGPCKCGRSGKKFKLNGRIPKAELRGCANV
jgi:hypothetical protein